MAKKKRKRVDYDSPLMSMYSPEYQYLMRQNAPENANVAGLGDWFSNLFSRNKQQPDYHRDTVSMGLGTENSLNGVGNGGIDWNNQDFNFTGQSNQQQFDYNPNSELSKAQQYQLSFKDPENLAPKQTEQTEQKKQNEQQPNTGSNINWGGIIGAAGTSAANAIQEGGSAADIAAGIMGIPVLAKMWKANTEWGDARIKEAQEKLTNPSVKYIQDANDIQGAGQGIKLNNQKGLDLIDTSGMLTTNNWKKFSSGRGSGTWWKNMATAQLQGAAAGSVGGPWGALGGATAGLLGSIGGLFGAKSRAKKARDAYNQKMTTLRNYANAENFRRITERDLSNQNMLSNGLNQQKLQDMANFKAYGGNLYPDGGGIDPYYPESQDPVYEGGELPEITVSAEPMPWYEKWYNKSKRALGRGWDNFKKAMATPTMTALPGQSPTFQGQFFPTMPSTVGDDLEYAASIITAPWDMEGIGQAAWILKHPIEAAKLLKQPVDELVEWAKKKISKDYKSAANRANSTEDALALTKDRLRNGGFDRLENAYNNKAGKTEKWVDDPDGWITDKPAINLEYGNPNPKINTNKFDEFININSSVNPEANWALNVPYSKNRLHSNSDPLWINHNVRNNIDELHYPDELRQQLLNLDVMEIPSSAWGRGITGNNVGAASYGRTPAIFTDRPIKYSNNASKSQLAAHEYAHTVYYPDKLPKDIFNPKSKYLRSANGAELNARGTQIKNYFGLKEGEQLTAEHLKYAKNHMTKDLGYDNNMTEFFESIKDYKKAAQWLNEHSPAIGGITAGIGVLTNLDDEQNIKAMGGQFDMSLSPNMMSLWNDKQNIDKQKTMNQQMNFGLGNSFNQKLNTFDYGGNLYPDGGGIDPYYPESQDPVYEGGELPEITVSAEPMPWYEKVWKSYKRNIINPLIQLPRRMTSFDAQYAESYDKDYFTFDEAYKDARNKGQKTFFWNNNYYNTDYEGSHGKQYQQDVASGKAANWEQIYPNYTNPELRREKQEELDTYGITNEQTKNKTPFDMLFRKIPARGYNLNDAISKMVGEFNVYDKFNNEEDLRASLLKKYPEFNSTDIPIKTSSNGNLIIGNVTRPTNMSDEMWEAFSDDVTSWNMYNVGEARPEVHRGEYDYLLGFPNKSNSDYTGNIKISKYKTGSLPYYYTTSGIEASEPFISDSDINKYNTDYNNAMARIEELESKKKFPNKEKWQRDKANGIINMDMADADKKDELLNMKYQKEIDKIYDNISAKRDDFINKYYDDENFRTKWENNGIYINEGDLDLLDWAKVSKLPEEDLKLLGDIGFLQNIPKMPKLKHGNHLAKSSDTDYYVHENDYNNGKYEKYIQFIKNKFTNNNDHNKYHKEAVDLRDLINAGALGTYTLGVPKDNSYISVWDKFDIDPFGSGNDSPVIKIGNPYEYYTRFYRKGAEPNIDSLYNNFSNTRAMGGNLYTDLSPNMMSLWNDKQNIDKQKTMNQQMNFGLGNSFNQKLNTFDYGGSMNGMDLPTNMQYYENGGSHEQNPNGGIQVGQDQQGNPNLVEEGEFRYGDYVFSDRIEVDPDVLSMYNIASSKSNKKSKNKPSYADMAKKYADKNKELVNDPISKNSLNAYMDKLQKAQEDQKYQEQLQAQQDQQLADYRNALKSPTQSNPMYGSMKYNGLGNANQGTDLGNTAMGGVDNSALSNVNRSGNEMMGQMAAYGGNLFGDGGKTRRAMHSKVIPYTVNPYGNQQLGVIDPNNDINGYGLPINKRTQYLTYTGLVDYLNRDNNEPSIYDLNSPKTKYDYNTVNQSKNQNNVPDDYVDISEPTIPYVSFNKNLQQLTPVFDMNNYMDNWTKSKNTYKNPWFDLNATPNELTPNLKPYERRYTDDYVDKMLNNDNLRARQLLLADEGLYSGPIDGIWGKASQAAWDEFNKIRKGQYGTSMSNSSTQPVTTTTSTTSTPPVTTTTSTSPVAGNKTYNSTSKSISYSKANEEAEREYYDKNKYESSNGTENISVTNGTTPQLPVEERGVLKNEQAGLAGYSPIDFNKYSEAGKYGLLAKGLAPNLMNWKDQTNWNYNMKWAPSNELEALGHSSYASRISDHLGDYIAPNLMDVERLNNQAMAQTAAQQRGVQNVSGSNRGFVGAQSAATDYNGQMGIGNNYATTEQYNADQKQKAAEFNRATNQFNAQANNDMYRDNLNAWMQGRQMDIQAMEAANRERQLERQYKDKVDRDAALNKQQDLAAMFDNQMNFLADEAKYNRDLNMLNSRRNNRFYYDKGNGWQFRGDNGYASDLNEYMTGRGVVLTSDDLKQIKQLDEDYGFGEESKAEKLAAAKSIIDRRKEVQDKEFTDKATKEDEDLRFKAGKASEIHKALAGLQDDKGNNIYGNLAGNGIYGKYLDRDLYDEYKRGKISKQDLEYYIEAMKDVERQYNNYNFSKYNNKVNTDAYGGKLNNRKRGDYYYMNV